MKKSEKKKRKRQNGRKEVKGNEVSRKERRRGKEE